MLHMTYWPKLNLFIPFVCSSLINHCNLTEMYLLNLEFRTYIAGTKAGITL